MMNLNYYKKTKTKTMITLGYLLGFSEADGSFQIHGNRFNPQVSWSQKSNTNSLSDIQNYLTKLGYTTTIDKGSSGRAPKLTLEGRNQVCRFLTYLNQQNVVLFIGPKHRDLLILFQISCVTNLTVLQKLGLKFSLHKLKHTDPDLDAKACNRKSRDEYEAEFNLPKDSSKMDPDTISLLEEIDRNFEKHQNDIRAKMAANQVILSPDYMTGIIDSDGSYTTSVRARIKNKGLEFERLFTLSMEDLALIVIEVFQYTLKSKGKIYPKVSKRGSKKGQITSYQLRIVRVDDIRALIELHKQFPIQGDFRLREFNALLKALDLLSSREHHNRAKLDAFIDEIYDISSKSKGPPRISRKKLNKRLDSLSDWLK